MSRGIIVFGANGSGKSTLGRELTRILNFKHMDEEKTVSQIASECGVHPTMLHTWKKQFLERMPDVFKRGETNADKLRKKYESKKEELLKEIGQLTVEVNWLKKTGFKT